MRSVVVALLCAACSGPARAPAPVDHVPEPTAAPDAAPPEPEAPKLVIGHVASMTGAMAVFGTASDNGLRLALDGRADVELVTYDDAGKAQETAVMVRRVIEDDGAQLVIGGVASALAIAGGEAADQAGVPMIVTGATNPQVIEVGERMFRVVQLDRALADAAARFAREHLKAAKAVIVLDESESSLVDLAEHFQASFTALGGKVLRDHGYHGDVVATKSLIEDLEGADVVFLAGYATQVPAILIGARDAGVKAPFLGSDTWDAPELLDARDVLDGSYHVTQFAADEPRAIVTDFVARYRERYGAPPDAIAALGYDAGLLALDAIRRAAGGDVTVALRETRDLEGVTGVFSIDDRREVVRSTAVIGFAGGKPQLVTRMSPVP